MVLVCVLCCIGHCFGAAPSLSLSYLPLLSVSYFSYLSLSLSLCLLLALSVLCGRAETTTNNKEFSRVFLCVRACVRGWLPIGWLLWWHDCWNARIVVDVLENCFTVLRVKSTFVWFLLIFDIEKYPERIPTLCNLNW